MANLVRNVCYSLPRLITMAVQCTFYVYFWELYITEFGWSPPEYGVVSSLYNFAQFASFIGLGAIFKYVIERTRSTDQTKLNETKYILMSGTFLHWVTYFLLIILPISWYGIKTPFVDSLFGKTSKFWYTLFNGPVDISNLTSNKYLCVLFCVLYFPFRVCWTILYPFMKIFYLFVTNFARFCSLLNMLMILLVKILWFGLTFPFKVLWHPFNLLFRVIQSGGQLPTLHVLPYQKTFRSSFFNRKKSKFVSLNELPSNTINLGYFPDLDAYTALKRLFQETTSTLGPESVSRPTILDPSSVPDPPLDLDPSQLFGIITIDRPKLPPGNGGILIDYQRLPPRAPFRPKPFLDASAVPDPPLDLDLLRQISSRDVADIGPWTHPIFGQKNNVLIRFLKSWKDFVNTKTFCVYILTILNGVGQSAHELSNKALESYIYKDPGKIGDAINMNLSFYFSAQLLIYIIFSILKFNVHSRAFFAETFYLLSILFFALCIPLLSGFYIGTTKDDAKSSKGIKGPVLYLCIKWACLTIFHSTIVFLIFSGGPLISYVGVFLLDGNMGITGFGNLMLFGALIGTSWTHIVITKLNKNIGRRVFGDFLIQMSVTGGCIVLQLFVFMLLYSHNWWWNKNKWFNYLLFMLTGAVNAIFVTYINILLGNLVRDVRARDWKWMFIGGFYSGTNMIISRAMLAIFRSFGKDEIRYCGCKCLRISYRYSFPSVYENFTFLLIIANLVAFVVYVLAHFVDQLIAAIYKFVDAAGQFKAKAEAFRAAAGKIPKNGNGARILKGARVGAAVQEFQKAATKFGDDSISGAAYNFSKIAGKFKEFADEISKIQYWNKLLNLCIIRKFKIAASSFKTKVEAFSVQAGMGPSNNDGFLYRVNEFYKAGDGDLVQKFQEAARAFGQANSGVGDKFSVVAQTFNASNEFMDVANKIKSGSLDITSQYVEFQKAASTGTKDKDDTPDNFKHYAGQFCEKAGQVGNGTNAQQDKNDLNIIKRTFLAAAIKFQEAANAFNDTAKVFDDIL